MIEDIEKDFNDSVLEYYEKITKDDYEYSSYRELIEDALEIATNHLTNCLNKQNDLENVYTKLKKKIQKLQKEIELVEQEKVSSMRTPFPLNFRDCTSEALIKKKNNLEDSIVKFKLLKAELCQKKELLQDTIVKWQQDLASKHKILENLTKEMERYTEYRNYIQKSIYRNSISGNSTTRSASSSFYNINTARILNSSITSDRNSFAISNKSNNNSFVID